LDLFMAKGSTVIDVYARVGSSGLASYTGGGVRALGWRPHARVSLGAELDVWNQPALLLEQRNVYDPPQRWGVNGGAFGTWTLFGSLGITGKIAYKSSGYLMGQPIDAGAYGYFGVTIAPGSP
jgi:hypothetical protein